MSGALNRKEWLAACGDLAKTYEQAWEEADRQMTATYRLAGKRQGWEFRGCIRTDMPDGYTEFRKPNGTVHAVVMTCFLTPPEKDG